MEIPLLKDIVVIFGLSIGVLFACHSLKIPSIVGFLLTGIICGPEGLGLVGVQEEVSTLAEIGIVVLLFTVGLEFSIKKILEFKEYFIVAGPLQVGFTIFGGVIVALLIGRPLNESIFLGCLLSLSSTAIVMRFLQERAETNTPYGRLILGVLIFQDVVVVVMMLLIPILAEGVADFDLTALFLIAKGVFILLLTFYSAIQLVPRLLYYVAKTRSREMFILTLLVICFSVAWVTSSIGLSLALGAFLAGLTISESEYRYHAMGDVLPLQDIFTSFFFVSIGMLLDVTFLIKHPFLILSISSAVLVLKGGLITLISLCLGLPIRPSIIAGFSLSQVGEFSFVLASSGVSHGMGTEFLHQLFLAVAIITMGMTPILIAIAPKFAAFFSRLPLPEWVFEGREERVYRIGETEALVDHVLIIGYGFSGRNLARSTREAGIPYVIIDMNPEMVRKEKKRGEPIYFGDATRQKVLLHANIEKAKAVAILINDPLAALRILERVKEVNPSLYVIVRIRYVEEMRAFFQLGADDVIPDELGSSVEVFTRVLRKYEVAPKQIDKLVATLRTEGYEVLRPRYTAGSVFSDLKGYLRNVGVRSVHLSEESPFAGKTLEEIQLKRKFGVTLLVIKRGQLTIDTITAQTQLLGGDRLVVVGTQENLDRSEGFFSG